MNDQQHTPGPWVVGTVSEGVFVSGADRSVIAKMLPDGPNKEADARRIVACVNALQGVPTEELEEAASFGIKDVRVGNLFSASMELQRQLSDMTNQRDQARTDAATWEARAVKEASRAHDLEQRCDELNEHFSKANEWAKGEHARICAAEDRQRAAEQQRDELLAALEGVVDFLTYVNGDQRLVGIREGSDISEEMAPFLAAIAKAKGEAV